MLTEEKINANYLTFINRLEKYNCYSSRMIDDMGDLIKHAPYNTSLEWGGAYDGGLIDVTLNILCKVGAQINTNTLGSNGGDKVSHPFLCVNQNMLMRVLLLANIAKAKMFVPNNNKWQRDNQGKMYTFTDSSTKLKVGERSLFLCQKYGIQLEEEEFEAFLSLDVVDDIGERNQSPITTIVRTAKMFTNVELRQIYYSSIKHEEIER